MPKNQKKYEWEIGESLPKIDNHSKVKLEILSKYLEIYMKVLCGNIHTTNLNLYIVDGFAGGGVYKDGTLGSPLALMQTVARTKDMINYEKSNEGLKTVNFNVKYVFVEKYKSIYNFLYNEIKQRGLLDDNVEIINGEFKRNLNDIISYIKRGGKSQRCLFVLDQYGYKDAPIDTVRQIFNNFSKAEVILTFSVDSLIDYLSVKSEKTLINLGLSKDEAQKLIDTRADNDYSRHKIQPILYKFIVKRTGARFYTPFFITSNVNHKSYWLFHLSSHEKAREEMIKLHWDKQNTFAHYGSAGLNMFVGYDPKYQNQLFGFDDIAKKQSLISLCSELPKYICDIKEITFGGLNSKIANTTPATEDMLKESLNESIRCGEIKAVAKNGTQRQKGSSLKKDDRLKYIHKRFFT